MSDKRARWIGHPDGVDLEGIPLKGTDAPGRCHVAHGAQLPTEIDGFEVPASYRDGLLAQGDNWTVVNQPTGKKNATEDEG
jgi:hypothetical protein